MTVLDFRTLEAKSLNGQRACTICGTMFRPKRMRGDGSYKTCSPPCTIEQRARGRAAVGPWTPERIETARLMWADGQSAGTIAAELGNGLSRSAVIGKVHREHFKRSQPLAERKPYKRPSRAKPVRTGSFKLPLPFVLPPEPVIVADEDIPQAQRCTLMQLRNYTCRFPIGDPQSKDFYYCGSPTADLATGIPYCFAHFRRAHAT